MFLQSLVAHLMRYKSVLYRDVVQHVQHDVQQCCTLFYYTIYGEIKVIKPANN